MGRKAEHRGEAKPTGAIADASRRVYGPEKRTVSNPDECSLGMREMSAQGAVSPDPSPV